MSLLHPTHPENIFQIKINSERLFFSSYQASCETFYNFWQIFSKGLSLVNSPSLREHFELKTFLLVEIKNLFLSGNKQKNFVIFLPESSWNDCQICLVPFQTIVLNEVIFCGKFVFRSFLRTLGGKNPAGLSKN